MKGAPALKTLMPTQLKINWEQLSKENEKFKEQFRSRVLEKK